ncbi:hypothetical protein ACF3N7_04660 [Cruoricaptor ignavus]
MNVKFFENVLKYGSVLVCCVIVGIFSRIIYLNTGGDVYTGNAIMWTVIAGLFILYSGIMIFLHEVSTTVTKKKSRKEFVKTDNKPSEPVFNSDPIDINRSVETLKLPSNEPDFNIQEIRNLKTQTLSKIAEEKKIIAINYTREEFALHISDEDLDRLCESVSIYAENVDFENLKSVSVRGLVNLDLFHFGWNLWNHFRNRDQKETAVFLKTVFAESLSYIEEESIKKHLKDDEQKGIIKIKKVLTSEVDNY